MNEILGEIIQFDEIGEYDENTMKELTEKSNVNMYILTNINRIDGAVCIIYPNLLNDLALSIGSGFYVIPSSVHEVIIVPSENTYESDDIKDMIREINDTQVKLEEILSYSLYYFDNTLRKLIKI
jgi:hypothetical protein